MLGLREDEESRSTSERRRRREERAKRYSYHCHVVTVFRAAMHMGRDSQLRTSRSVLNHFFLSSSDAKMPGTNYMGGRRQVLDFFWMPNFA